MSFSDFVRGKGIDSVPLAPFLGIDSIFSFIMVVVFSSCMNI